MQWACGVIAVFSNNVLMANTFPASQITNLCETNLFHLNPKWNKKHSKVQEPSTDYTIMYVCDYLILIHNLFKWHEKF